MKFQLLILSVLILEGLSSHCGSHPKNITNNTLPFWEGQPRFIKQNQNGKLFEIGSEQLNNTMRLIHLYGTMEEMGFAQGELLADVLTVFLQDCWNYIVNQMAEGFPSWIPKEIAFQISSIGAKIALDLTYLLTYPYTTEAYYVEMWHMTLGMNKTEMYPMARRIHMIGELTKGHCSMFGVWGNATKNGQTIQLRSLDWDFDGPFKNFPAIIVYHPSDPKIGNVFANIGFTGWLGMLSGVNEHKMGISEIGVYFSDASFGKESRIGNAFTFMMRDVIQFDHNLMDSIQRLQSDRKTCDLLLGVGDGKSELSTFRGFQISNSVANVIDDQNLIPNATWHPKIQNAVYFGMDWDCPNWDIRLAQLIQQYWGQIDAEIAVRQITSGLTSGNLQAVVYDLTNQYVYVAYGYEKDGYRLEAWQKSYVKLDLKSLWAEPKP